LKRFALLGEPLGHSLSPVLHKAIYRQLEIDDASYRTVELPDERLKSFFSGFRVGGFDGVNVTIPHKASIIALLDEVDSKAKLLNAVNCVNRVCNVLTGFNTDLLGFAYSLRQNDASIEGNEFAIIGAGGSAQAVGAVLAEGEAKTINVVNRTPERAEQLKETILAVNDQVKINIVDESGLVERAKNLSCIVNTTSIGMQPNTSKSPLSPSSSAEIFSENVLAFDLIYNPLNIVAHVDMNALARDLEKAIK